jgi:hypothetical protein
MGTALNLLNSNEAEGRPTFNPQNNFFLFGLIYYFFRKQGIDLNNNLIVVTEMHRDYFTPKTIKIDDNTITTTMHRDYFTPKTIKIDGNTITTTMHRDYFTPKTILIMPLTKENIMKYS